MLKKIYYLTKKSFTWTRFTNALKIIISYYISIIIKKPIVWGYPPIVMIEPTNYCNLRCPLCPSGANTLKRDRGFMTYGMFKQIIDEIEKYTFMILLWNQGEPFLNPDIIDMIEYAHSKKIYIMTSTNANELPSSEYIVKSGLDLMLISLDGASQDSYNKYRNNGSLQKVIDNVRELVKIRAKVADSTLQLINQFLVMKHNENEIERIKEMTTELGLDDTVLKNIQIYSKEDIVNFLPENPKYRRYKITGDNFELKYGIKNRCYRLWTQPVINWNGDVAVCCFDKNNEYKIGSVKKHNFLDLWKSNRMNVFRQTILKNRQLFDFCRNCGEGVDLKIKKV